MNHAIVSVNANIDKCDNGTTPNKIISEPPIKRPDWEYIKRYTHRDNHDHNKVEYTRYGRRKTGSFHLRRLTCVRANRPCAKQAHQDGETLPRGHSMIRPTSI